MQTHNAIHVMCNFMLTLQTEKFSREVYFFELYNWPIIIDLWYIRVYNITYYTFLRFIAT